MTHVRVDAGEGEGEGEGAVLLCPPAAAARQRVFAAFFDAVPLLPARLYAARKQVRPYLGP